MVVVVAGTGQIRDIQIEAGTTAGDILNQLTLRDYLLSKVAKVFPQLPRDILPEP